MFKFEMPVDEVPKKVTDNTYDFTNTVKFLGEKNEEETSRQVSNDRLFSCSDKESQDSYVEPKYKEIGGIATGYVYVAKDNGPYHTIIVEDFIDGIYDGPYAIVRSVDQRKNAVILVSAIIDIYQRAFKLENLRDYFGGVPNVK